jgi:aminopeptidase N
MRNNEAPKTIYLKDYREPPFRILTTDLNVDLFDTYAIVTATLDIERAPHAAPDEALRLNGVDLELLELCIGDRKLCGDSFVQIGEELEIPDVPDRFTLRSQVRIYPARNTALEGLYLSNGMYCTQCEAEGFRKITYYLDRPDVMAVFRTTISADKAACPILLANGNPVASGELPQGRHFVTWEDPFRKPSYLFAMVAGKLACLEDSFVTASGREVALRIYVEPQDLEKCGHAMASLKKSMRWDETAYGREYDLDIFMIVAVSHFNMGAMENKGLNIFNTSCVLAHPATTTDAGFQRVESVVAHEYFHNWSGNRVTCRDWFQLSLKEGFTVFRDQQFSADVLSASVQRIEDVGVLRSHQFAEDAGPLSHPVRPESFIEINNFYTATVYEKGAELVRMLQTLLGPEGFRKGSDLYFSRHDGQAVTVEDFVQAMADATGYDLADFMRWYRQPGTPELHVTDSYDPVSRRYSLTFAQRLPERAGFAAPQPLPIPIRLALLSGAGDDMSVTREGTAAPQHEFVVVLAEAEETVTFTGVGERPVPSLLRDFSAPVRLEFACSDEQLTFLMRHDSNGFNRWSAGQTLFSRMILALAADYVAGRTLRVPDAPVAALIALLPELLHSDVALAAKMLALPSESYLAEQLAVVDPEALHVSRNAVRYALALAGEGFFRDSYGQLQTSTTDYEYSSAAMAARAFKNACLDYLLILAKPADVASAEAQFAAARHMNDELGALACMAHAGVPVAQACMDRFYARWRHEPLVLDQWFVVQATAPQDDVLDHVRSLLGHPDFSLRNPNRVRALLGQFANNNPARFHRADGAGYALLCQQIRELDVLNPQVAARLLGAFSTWTRLEPGRRAHVRAELQAIRQSGQASPDVHETVTRLLAAS